MDNEEFVLLLPKLYGTTLTNRRRSQRSYTETVVLRGEQLEAPIVAKIFHCDIGTALHINELEIYNRVQHLDNITKQKYNFIIKDDFSRWGDMSNCLVGECENKSDTLHFIVMEYVENGHPHKCFSESTNKQQIGSVLVQYVLSLCVLSDHYDIDYNNIRPGNFLIGKTDKTILNYIVNGIDYSIPTYGAIFKFVDFSQVLPIGCDHNVLVTRILKGLRTIISGVEKCDRSMYDELYKIIDWVDGERICIEIYSIVEAIRRVCEV